MKALLLTLCVLALAFAQFEDFDAALIECKKDCCVGVGAGGNWKNGTCNLSVISNSVERQNTTWNLGLCERKCNEHALASVSGLGHNDICCAPAAILLAISGAAVFYRRSRVNL